MQNVNDNLRESIQADYVPNQSNNNSLVASLIDREAKVQGDTFYLGDEGGARLEFALASPADRVVVEIYDAGGTLVRKDDLGPMAAGQHDYIWDGLDDSGKAMRSGIYTYQLKAKSDGKEVNSTLFTTGRITGVRYVNGVATLLIGDLEVALPDVAEIRRPL